MTTMGPMVEITKRDRTELLAEEAFMILHSGEIPEVAMHSSLYYLTKDPEGPGLAVEEGELLPLKDAVVGRYRDILLRDLTPENRDKGLYRGLARCIANWQRLCRFCRQEQRDVSGLREEVAAALIRFLVRELEDVNKGGRVSCVNCTAEQLEQLAADLHLSPADLPAGWRSLCA